MGKLLETIANTLRPFGGDAGSGLLGAAAVLVACGGSTSASSGTDAGRSGGATASGGSTGTGGVTGTGGAGGCNPPCGTARDCCTDHCVNLQNDPLNCGFCGKRCGTGTYCEGGQCTPPPCQTTCTSGTCCGTACCGTGQLCCDPQGPLSAGPVCTSPVNGTCPMGCAPLCVCASPDTPIATPGGDRPIAELRVGDLVYSVDHGVMKAVPISRINRTPVLHHEVMRVALRSGVVLRISAGHPTADGRTFGELRRGDSLDGVPVESSVPVPYAFDATYDILPDSDTGAYFAGGTLIGSTLTHGGALVTVPTTPLSLEARSP